VLLSFSQCHLKVLLKLNFQNANHFISELDELKQTKQNSMYVCGYRNIQSEQKNKDLSAL